MKYKKGDCFKRMPEVVEGWNPLNKTKTIMIVGNMNTHYLVYSDEGYSFGYFEEEIDKYFYRLYTREEVTTMLDAINNIP